jgi:hypothetical protein
MAQDACLLTKGSLELIFNLPSFLTYSRPVLWSLYVTMQCPFCVFSDDSVQQLLKEILDERNSNLVPRCMTIRILCKLCWATVQYLEANILRRNPHFEDLISQLCNLLILLFPVIEVQDGEDNLGMSCSSHSETGPLI